MRWFGHQRYANVGTDLTTGDSDGGDGSFHQRQTGFTCEHMSSMTERSTTRRLQVREIIQRLLAEKAQTSAQPIWNINIPYCEGDAYEDVFSPSGRQALPISLKVSIRAENLHWIAGSPMGLMDEGTVIGRSNAVIFRSRP